MYCFIQNLWKLFIDYIIYKYINIFILFIGCLEKDTQLLGNYVDIPGDYNGIRSAEDCQKECQIHPSCIEFNYHEVEPFECLLKHTKIGKYKYSEGCDSCKDWTYGPKYCDEGKSF